MCLHCGNPDNMPLKPWQRYTLILGGAFVFCRVPSL
jgi:hypothetical protein